MSHAQRVRPESVALASIVVPVTEAALNVEFEDGRKLRSYRRDHPSLAKPGKEELLDRESTNVRVHLEEMITALIIEAQSQTLGRPIDVSGQMFYSRTSLAEAIKNWDRYSEAADIRSDSDYASLVCKAEEVIRQSPVIKNIGNAATLPPH